MEGGGKGQTDGRMDEGKRGGRRVDGRDRWTEGRKGDRKDGAGG